MAKARPVLLTALLSGAAVVGYLSYRLFVAPAAHEEPAATIRLGEDPAAESADERSQLAERLPEFSLVLEESDTEQALECGPCLREIPMLKELQTHRPDLQVVGIAVDRREPVVGFADKMQFNYPILIGESAGWEAAAAFGVNVYALPFTVFTAADGSVLGVHTGELHPEHLENLRAVLDDLKTGKIDLATARARVAGRI